MKLNIYLNTAIDWTKRLPTKVVFFSLPAILILLVIALIMQANSKKPITITNPNQNVPTPTQEVLRPLSKWATESGVIESENRLKNLNQSLQSVDLKESQLSMPILDMQVNFEE